MASVNIIIKGDKNMIWNDIHLNPSVEVYNEFGWGKPQYAVDSDGFVHLRGLIKNNGGTEQTILAFNLGEGLRPSKNVMFQAIAEYTPYRLDVAPNGDVLLRAFEQGLGHDWINLNGVYFHAS